MKKISHARRMDVCQRWIAVLCLLCGLSLTGCGNAPPAPAGAAPVAGNPPAGAAAEKPATEAEPAPPGQPPGQLPADVAPGQPADVGTKQPAKNPLINGLSQLLETNPALEDVDKSPIVEQLQQADDYLAEVKRQNRDAMRQANRQMRLRRGDTPVVVVIVAEGLSWDDLPFDNRAPVLMPEMSALAEQGTLCTQYYAGSPVLQDARWSLMTGKRSDKITARQNQRALLTDDELTLGETLWQAGYTTGLFGHWGLIAPEGLAVPDNHGYDVWAGTLGPAEKVENYPVQVHQNRATLKLLGNTEGQQKVSASHFAVEEALAFLRKYGPSRPVYVQLFLPAPGVTSHGQADVTPYEKEDWPLSAKQRATALTELDFEIGRVRKQLEELKLWSNTLLIVTGDAPPEHSLAELIDGSKSAQRGTAGELYEGGLRVPLLLSWPNRIPANRECPVVCASWDVCHTLYDAVAAYRRPRREQGLSLLPSLQPEAELPTRFLYWEVKNRDVAQAVRWRNWKAVRPAGQTTFELYDLSADPGESKNLASEHPEVLEAIQQRIAPDRSQARRS